MKNWLRRKLWNFIHQTGDEPNTVIGMSKTAGVERTGIDMDNSLRFNVLSCTGGVVLQLYRYDRKNDRSDNATHIIADGEDISERIGQIVAMEMLKS
jgi:hypothetical protein